MTIKTIQSFVKRKPFREFVIATSDGDTFKVTHVESVMVIPEDDLVVLHPAEGGLHLLDVSQIIRTSYLSKRKAQA